MIDLGSIDGLHKQERELHAYCLHCDRWSVLNLETMVRRAADADVDEFKRLDGNVLKRPSARSRSQKLKVGRHTKLESTVRYLGIEVDDALEIPSRLRRDGPRNATGAMTVACRPEASVQLSASRTFP